MLKNKQTIPIPEVKVSSDNITQIQEIVQENPFVELYRAVKRALLTIKESEEGITGEPFFKTIAIDTGQFERILLDDNLEYEVAFPAIFIHFVNVRYLVQQQRIGEGRATMRVRFILNTLNNQDEERELDPYVIFQRINVAIQDAKNHEPALNERCSLLYFDMPTTSNMLQAFWVDYEVWFRESSAWKYRNWVERYLVMPPFTDHDDAPKRDKDNHGNHNSPAHNDVSGIIQITEREEIVSDNTDSDQ